MVLQPSAVLPPAPPNLLDAEGRPRFGAYEGSVRVADLDTLDAAGVHGRIRKLARAKRWTYTCISTPEVLFGMAVVNLGYAGTGFFYAVDLQTGGILVEGSFPGIPGVTLKVNDRPGEGSNASLWAPNGHLRIHRAEQTSTYQIEARGSNWRLEALLDSQGAPPPLALVTPVVGSAGPAFTQKSTLLASAGTLRIGDRSWNLGGGYGGIDYTQGLLARRTLWRWAMLMGRTEEGLPVGINLAEGNYEGKDTENALWLNGELMPLAKPEFSFDLSEPMSPWEVKTADGIVQLRLEPKGIHAEHLKLMVVRSRFTQAAGLFSGTIHHPSGKTYSFSGVPGVSENQEVVW